MPAPFIHIVPYDPHWVERYARESTRLREAMGERCQALDHVGSTSVPGLAAKPIVDMVLESTVYPPDAAVIAALAALGYAHRGEFGVVGRHFFSKGDPRAYHLHLVPVGGPVATRMRAFRDHLRTHPEAAREYEAIKREAAHGQVLESHGYVEAKGPFVTGVLQQTGQGG